MSNHNGPMIVLDGEAYPYEEIQSLVRGSDGQTYLGVKSKNLRFKTPGTLPAVAADINRQLADHARACSTMVVEIPKGGE